MKPNDATHIETDGTFWKNAADGNWYHWNPYFKKWCGYVGRVNQVFLNKLKMVG